MPLQSTDLTRAAGGVFDTEPRSLCPLALAPLEGKEACRYTALSRPLAHYNYSLLLLVLIQQLRVSRQPLAQKELKIMLHHKLCFNKILQTKHLHIFMFSLAEFNAHDMQLNIKGDSMMPNYCTRTRTKKCAVVQFFGGLASVGFLYFIPFLEQYKVVLSQKSCS
jgi:hypothetical protein